MSQFVPQGMNLALRACNIHWFSEKCNILTVVRDSKGCQLVEELFTDSGPYTDNCHKFRTFLDWRFLTPL